MEREGEEAPTEDVSAEPPPTELVVAEAVAQTAAGASPVAIFLGIIAVLLLSFGGAALVLGGAGRVASGGTEATPTPQTAAPVRTAGGAAAAATADASRVRVVSTNARSRAMSGGTQYEVTFVWTLEGARENDPVVLQFYAGTRALGQQRGTLDPAVFNFSTGTLTVTVAMDCSTGGWTAEILTVRGQPIAGDSEATAAGVQCR